MSLEDDYWSWRRKSKESPAHLFDYNFVALSIDEATICCNDREGAEFIQGILIGHTPISHAIGGNIQYFDTLVEYAKVTQDDPEFRLQTLNDIAQKLLHAPRCGLKFLMAQLVLAYGCVGKYPTSEAFATNVVRHLGLMVEANELLDRFSKYSESSQD